MEAVHSGGTPLPEVDVVARDALAVGGREDGSLSARTVHISKRISH